MQCCVYTRFVYDVPYLDSFIEHYLQLGFDKIFILYHDVVPYHLPEHLIEEVEIIEVENNGNKLLNEYINIFKEDFDWVLNVDSDEFLVLHEHYPTIKDYISCKLQKNENINMFQFSWAWLHAFNPPPEFTINNMIKNYKIFVGSKDNADSENIIWVKSLTKVDHIEYITCHNCVLNTQAIIHIDNRDEYSHCIKDSSISFVDDTDNDENENNNTDINLLPRYYSKREFTYCESVLIHINTRNMMNTIIKGLNIHVTQVKRKRIKNLKGLKKFINNFRLDKPIYKETLQDFAKCIGYKIKFPLLCLEKEEINEKIYTLKVNKYNNPFCNYKYIPEQQQYHLENLQERMKTLFRLLDLSKFVKILNLFAVIFDNTFSIRQLIIQ